MSKLVRIQSTITISVTPGLQAKDVTNPDAHIADRLKVSAEWPKCTVLIKEGVGMYPADIVEWNTVKALAKDEILTIGETREVSTEEEKQTIEEFEHKIESIEEIKTKRTKRAKLEDVAEG